MPQALLLYCTNKYLAAGEQHTKLHCTIVDYHDLSHLLEVVETIVTSAEDILKESLQVVQESQTHVPLGTIRTMHCKQCGGDEIWQFVRRPIEHVAEERVWECTDCKTTLPPT